MRRLDDDDRGAVAILVAVVLVVLIGFAAFAVDVGEMYAERRQLQNGADAAALAVAWDCANGDCGTYETTGQAYADDNANDGMANVDDYEFTSNSVTVTTSTREATGNALRHWFAPVLGIDETTVRARATAAWGAVGNTSTVPLTFSYCEFELMAGDPISGNISLPTDVETVYFHTASQAETNRCDGPAGQDTPGGFGWLTPSGGQCEAYIEEGQVPSDTGNNVPSECSAAFFQSLIGQTVLMPIFADVTPPPTRIYDIVGFAAFEFTGYRLSGNPAYNRNTTCTGDQRCIHGRFVEYLDYGDEVDWGGGDLDFGTVIIALTG